MANRPAQRDVTFKIGAKLFERLESSASHRDLTPGEMVRMIVTGVLMRGHIDSVLMAAHDYELDFNVERHETRLREIKQRRKGAAEVSP